MNVTEYPKKFRTLSFSLLFLLFSLVIFNFGCLNKDKIADLSFESQKIVTGQVIYSEPVLAKTAVSVSGEIVNDQQIYVNKALSGATVSLGGKTVKTDSNGIFYFLFLSSEIDLIKNTTVWNVTITPPQGKLGDKDFSTIIDGKISSGVQNATLIKIEVPVKQDGTIDSQKVINIVQKEISNTLVSSNLETISTQIIVNFNDPESGLVTDPSGKGSISGLIALDTGIFNLNPAVYLSGVTLETVESEDKPYIKWEQASGKMKLTVNNILVGKHILKIVCSGYTIFESEFSVISDLLLNFGEITLKKISLLTGIEITAVSGNAQSGSVGNSFAIPLKVSVKDNAGNLLRGIKVDFESSDTGIVDTNKNITGNQTDSVTGYDGIAVCESWIAGNTPGIYSVKAFINGVSGAEFVFTAEATSLNAETFEITLPLTVKAGTLFNAQIRALDSKGNLVTTYSGNKILSFSGPRLGPEGTQPVWPSSISFVSGIASPQITLYREELTDITVTDGIIQGRSGKFNVEKADELKISVSPSTDTSVSADSPQVNISAKVSDLYGNPVPDGTLITVDIVDPAPVNAGGTGSIASELNTISGNVSTVFNSTSKAGDNFIVRMSYSGSEFLSGKITVIAGEVKGLSVEGVSSVTAGTETELSRIIAKDAFGNTVESYEGVKSISLSGASDSLTGVSPVYFTSATFIKGIATENLKFTVYKAESFDLSVVSGTVSGSLKNIKVNGNIADSMTISPENGVFVSADDTSLNILAVLKDGWGNPVNDGIPVSFLVEDPDSNNAFAEFSVSNSVNTVSGVATATLTTGTVAGDDYKVTAQYGDFTKITGLITVKSGTASKFALLSPVIAVAGQEFNITSISVYDAFNNIVKDYTGNKTINYTGASASPSGTLPLYTTAVNFTEGVSDTVLATTLYKKEDASLQVNDGAIYSNSVSVSVNPALAGIIEMTPQTDTYVSADTALQSITALVKDNYGNTVSDGTIVSFSLSDPLNDNTGGNGIMSSGSAVTVSGVAGITLTTQRVAGDDYLISATSNGVTQSTGKIIVSPGTASQLSIVAPTPQTAGVSFNITTIKALDNHGNTVTTYSGLKNLSYSGASNANSGTIPLYTTAVNFIGGVADTTLATTLYKVETIAITVNDGSISGSSGNITVNHNNPYALSIKSEPSIVIRNTVMNPGYEIYTVDQWQNICTSDNSTPVTVNIQTNPGSGVLSGTLTKNAVNGIAGFNDLSINEENSGYVLRFSSGSLTTVDTNSFSVVPPPPVILSFDTIKNDGYYKTLEEISFTVTYDQPVIVSSGIPSIALNSGGTATYVSGSGTTALIFNYTVQNGENSADLANTGTDSLNLNGATIKNAGGYDAFNALPASTVFSGAHNIVIDTIAPASPQLQGVLISSDLNGLGNTENHVNLALKNSFINFKVNIANQGAGNEAGTVFVKLSDSQGTPVTIQNSGIVIAGNAGVTAIGGFSNGDINGFSDGNLKVEAWIKDSSGNESTLSSLILTNGLNSVLPASPQLQGVLVSSDLNGLGNTENHVNLALKNSFSNFKVNIANQGAGNKAGTLYVKLSDSQGTPAIVQTTGTGITQNAVTTAIGGFSNDDVNSFIDGNLKVESWVIDSAGNVSIISSVTLTNGLDTIVPASPQLQGLLISSNLNGLGNTENHVNLALKNSFSNFKVNIANQGAGNKAGTLYVKLSDSQGTPANVQTSGIGIAQNAVTTAIGGFSNDDINSFIDGNLKVEAWITDNAGNISTVSSQILNNSIDTVLPQITNGIIGADNNYIDITFSEAVYSDISGTLIQGSDFIVNYIQNDDITTGMSISSIKINDSTNEASASVLAGGETVVRSFFTLTGVGAVGTATASLQAGNIALFDKAGNVMANTEITPTVTLNDLNLLKKLGFDYSFEGYTGSTAGDWLEIGTEGSIDLWSNSVTGSDSCRMDNPTASDNGRKLRYLREIPVEAGNTYSFGFHTFLQQSTEGVDPAETNFRLILEWNNASSNEAFINNSNFDVWERHFPFSGILVNGGITGVIINIDATDLGSATNHYPVFDDLRMHKHY